MELLWAYVCTLLSECRTWQVAVKKTLEGMQGRQKLSQMKIHKGQNQLVGEMQVKMAQPKPSVEMCVGTRLV